MSSTTPTAPGGDETSRTIATRRPLAGRNANDNRLGVPPLLQERSSPGRRAVQLPSGDTPETPLPQHLLRRDADPIGLPEISELEVVRHYTNLSQLNYAIDTTFYPLGSCTMKYNPKMNEQVAALPGFAQAHPHAPAEAVQGNYEVLFRLQDALAKIAGFSGVSLQPAAGAQGELTGILMIRAYHRMRGDTKRTRVLVPDSAHGTNPATCAMAGFEAVELPSDSNGNVDLDALKAQLDDTVAGLMITNPNTLGLFEERISQVIGAVHAAGGLVYGDGANMNAILGVVRPGDLGIDVMHFNLHKTFSTPHGGGGPGSGPVAAGPALVDFLPGPIVAESASNGTPKYTLEIPKHSIGRMKAFFGNFGMHVRAYTYILRNGGDGLRRVAEYAVLNANYLKHRVEKLFRIKYNRSCMHEFVATGTLVEGISTMDIAKRLIDYGFHPPTVYFPLIVKEALMFEPTETESRENLDAFADALEAVVEEARTDPDILHAAPVTTPVARLDEVAAARKPVLCYRG